MDSTDKTPLPQQRAPRVPLNFRLAPEAIARYDAQAEDYRLDRATVIRCHLAVAARHEDEVRAMLATAYAAQGGGA